jgi:hypothetical protein
MLTVQRAFLNALNTNALGRDAASESGPELRPALQAVLACDDELSVGQRDLRGNRLGRTALSADWRRPETQHIRGKDCRKTVAQGDLIALTRVIDRAKPDAPSCREHSESMKGMEATTAPELDAVLRRQLSTRRWLRNDQHLIGFDLLQRLHGTARPPNLQIGVRRDPQPKMEPPIVGRVEP